MDDTRLERRLAAVWFADIADFTRLSATNEPRAYQVMEAMRQAVRAAVQARGGTLVKFLGDGALAHFGSAEAAVEAGLQVHRRFEAATARMLEEPRLRVGVHLGEVAVGPDGDLFGDGVNRAARLQEMAEPGELVVSQSVQQLLRQRPELDFHDRGIRHPKGLDEPVQVYLVEARGWLARELAGLQTPPPERRGLFSSRAVALGIAAGLVAFLGMGVWTAMSLPSEGAEAAPSMASARMSAAADFPVLEAGDSLPPWPAMAPEPQDEPEEPAAPRRPPPPQDEVRRLANAAQQRLRDVPMDEIEGHETLPLLRRAVDEARAGSPAGERRDVLRGLLLFLDRRAFDEAEEAFKAALTKDPGSSSTRLLYSQLLSATGRGGEALYQLSQAEDGLEEARRRRALGAVQLRAGRPDAAERELRRVVRLHPSELAPRLLLARALASQERWDDALQVLNGAPPALETTLMTAWIRGRQDGDAAALPPGLVRALQQKPDGPYLTGLLAAASGRHDEALERLDTAIRAGSPSLVWLGVDPEWASLRGDPRFAGRLQRAGLCPGAAPVVCGS